MDIEVLVAKVYERKPIWNRWDKEHSNRNLVDKLWAEISQEMNCEESKLRKKWKILRDQFAVELGKLQPARSGDAASEHLKSKWQYFTLLHFLKDVVKPRSSTGNLSSLLTNATSETSPLTSHREKCQMSSKEQGADLPIVECISLNSSCVSDNTDGDKKLIREQCSTSQVTPPNKRPNKRYKMNEFNQSILDIEKDKVQYLKEKMQRKEDGSDEDLMFLKSLLSHIKLIPREQKLMFRCRMQELVQEFAYAPTNTTNYGCSSSATTSTNVPT